MREYVVYKGGEGVSPPCDTATLGLTSLFSMGYVSQPKVATVATLPLFVRLFGSKCRKCPRTVAAFFATLNSLILLYLYIKIKEVSQSDLRHIRLCKQRT